MNPSKVLKSLVRRVPQIKRLIAERDALVKAYGIAPPGHFYSPIVSIAEVRKDESTIFGDTPHTIPGIELNEPEQLSLLKEFAAYYEAMPFKATKTEGLRYYFENLRYSYSDAIILYCMIRRLRPKRIIEVGSGFSSCVTLDTNQIFFDNSIQTTFIEPYPNFLKSLITDDDKRRVTIIPLRLQDVRAETFRQLEENDILFVDSTHVSKVNSDVNRIFFEILPSLRSGVQVHFHDIFYPFEYPKEWFFEGRSWNEIYMLRTFLQYNDAFRIIFMNTFMHHYHEAEFEKLMPLCLKNPGGSIWIRKE